MKQVRVLVAEDNEDHRFLTMRALRDVKGVNIDVDGVAQRRRGAGLRPPAG